MSARGLARIGALLEAFPLTPSGKILKRQLVEDTRAGRIRPQPVRWTQAAS